MNIALLGYGNMGKEVERIARERNMTIKQILNLENNLRGMGITPKTMNEVDVCIDFSTPTAVIHNIGLVAEFGKNIVVGTTGWYDKLREVEKIVKEKKIGLLYSPNFSIGMNVFYQILTSAAHQFDKFDQYDVALHEMHHRGKMDSPSGTALAMGQIILQHIRRKKEMLHETARREIKPEQVHITSSRIGHVFGRHEVIFDSEADCVELIHTAKNRSGFAIGALIAAEWLKGKKGMYTLKDVLSSM